MATRVVGPRRISELALEKPGSLEVVVLDEQRHEVGGEYRIIGADRRDPARPAIAAESERIVLYGLSARQRSGENGGMTVDSSAVRIGIEPGKTTGQRSAIIMMSVLR